MFPIWMPPKTVFVHTIGGHLTAVVNGGGLLAVTVLLTACSGRPMIWADIGIFQVGKVGAMSDPSDEFEPFMEDEDETPLSCGIENPDECEACG